MQGLIIPSAYGAYALALQLSECILCAEKYTKKISVYSGIKTAFYLFVITEISQLADEFKRNCQIPKN